MCNDIVNLVTKRVGNIVFITARNGDFMKGKKVFLKWN